MSKQLLQERIKLENRIKEINAELGQTDKDNKTQKDINNLLTEAQVGLLPEGEQSKLVIMQVLGCSYQKASTLSEIYSIFNSLPDENRRFCLDNNVKLSDLRRVRDEIIDLCSKARERKKEEFEQSQTSEEELDKQREALLSED